MNMNFPWERFWYPLGTRLQLVDGGFLPDPSTLGGQYYNPDLFTLEQVAQRPCLVLLGEPRIGKSFAVTQDAERYDGRKLIADLGEYGSEQRIREAVFRSDIVKEWAETEGELYLILDSLDESWLPIKELVGFIADEVRPLPLDRLLVRVICRSALWSSRLTSRLADVWNSESLSVLELAPLRRNDVQTAASAKSLDARAFMRCIETRKCAPLAAQPQLLRDMKSGSPSFVMMRSGAMEHPQSEEIEVGSSIHLTFQEFQPGDLVG